MHRTISILVSLLLATQLLVAQDDAKRKKGKQPLPKKVEFELGVWDARLGLEDRQMRELQYAARAAVAKLNAVKKAAEDEELEVDPWDEHRTDAEPWKSLRLPKALKAKSFTDVAGAVLTKQQISNLAALKKHLKDQSRTEMQIARAHQRAANLTKTLSLTEEQVGKLVTLLQKRAKSRRALMEKFRGREDEIPQPKTLREDPAFMDILDANQKKRLEKSEKKEDKARPQEKPQEL